MPRRLALRVALPRPCAPFVALLVATWLMIAGPAAAQVQRNFPQTALRGQMTFVAPPDVQIGGQAARLAPGVRIRGLNNMLEMSGALIGTQAWVHYTLDTQGLVLDVWLLRPEELAKRPWPRTPADAAAWSFDPVAQEWTRP